MRPIWKIAPNSPAPMLACSNKLVELKSTGEYITDDESVALECALLGHDVARFVYYVRSSMLVEHPDIVQTTSTAAKRLLSPPSTSSAKYLYCTHDEDLISKLLDNPDGVTSITTRLENIINDPDEAKQYIRCTYSCGLIRGDLA